MAVRGKRRSRDVISRPVVPGQPDEYNASDVDRAIEEVATATTGALDKIEPHIGAGGTSHALTTTSAAGFAPELDGDPTHYLDGTGAWSRPDMLLRVSGTAAQFLAAILPLTPSALFVDGGGGYIMTSAALTAGGWIVWSITAPGYKRSDFDADFAAFPIYDVDTIEA